MPERHRGFDVGRRDAAHRILWIHGYTGSPDAFLGTAELLAHRLDAHVHVPLLPGHGTNIDNLRHRTFDELYSSARHFARSLPYKKPVALIGYSFGGYIASLLAAEFEIRALVVALTPYRLRFPLWLPGIAPLLNAKTHWEKYLNAEDIRIRKGIFYYPYLPGNSLSLIHEGNARLAKILPIIPAPILTIHTARDPLANPASGYAITRENGNTENECQILPDGRHALFFRPERELEEEIVTAFLQKHFYKRTTAEHKA